MNIKQVKQNKKNIKEQFKQCVINVDELQKGNEWKKAYKEARIDYIDKKNHLATIAKLSTYASLLAAPLISTTKGLAPSILYDAAASVKDIVLYNFVYNVYYPLYYISEVQMAAGVALGSAIVWSASKLKRKLDLRLQAKAHFVENNADLVLENE